MNLLPCLFFIAVCITAFMLMRVVESGIFGETRRERREFEREFGKGGLRSGEPKLLRRPHLEQLTPFERKIESRREFQRLRRLIEEAGLITSIYRVILYGCCGSDGPRRSKLSWPTPSTWSSGACGPVIPLFPPSD
jgi:hypothetical protein